MILLKVVQQNIGQIKLIQQKYYKIMNVYQVKLHGHIVMMKMM